jgi:hypothetical protein
MFYHYDDHDHHSYECPIMELIGIIDSPVLIPTAQSPIFLISIESISFTLITMNSTRVCGSAISSPEP